MSYKLYASYVVEIRVGFDGLTEKGWEQFGDAVQDVDLESYIHDEIVTKLALVLPRDFPDIFQIRVREEQIRLESTRIVPTPETPEASNT